MSAGRMDHDQRTLESGIRGALKAGRPLTADEGRYLLGEVDRLRITEDKARRLVREMDSTDRAIGQLRDRLDE